MITIYNFWLLDQWDGLSRMIMDTPGQSVYDLGTLQENFTKVLSVRRSQSIFFSKLWKQFFAVMYHC